MIDLSARLLGSLRGAVSSILDAQRPAHSLQPEVSEMTKLLADAGMSGPAGQADNSGGETQTSNGLALSPIMAAMCADDFVRTVEFVRGTHAAIVDIRKQFPDRPARVLYAGCGPHATLAVPLMAVFTPEEVLFTLLDIHPESIAFAKCMITALGLASRVAHYETIDAGLYQIDPAQPPDVIMMEMMQACLAAEPQVAITRHLLRQAPQSLLIPEEVRIELALVDPSLEFGLDGVERDAGDIERDRIPVATVFVVNRESVNSWQNISGDRLPGLAAHLPEAAEPRYQPMLFTNIYVYQNHVLKDYDSGLTSPRLFAGDKPLRAGDTIYFHYELGRDPGLIGL